MSDYQAIKLIQDYIINPHKKDTEYIKKNKKRLQATRKAINKKIYEYIQLKNEIREELSSYFYNAGEVLAEIKKDILYGTANGVDNTLQYELYQAIDNSNKQLYKDIMQVYKRRIKELQKKLEIHDDYKIQLEYIRLDIGEMLASI